VVVKIGAWDVIAKIQRHQLADIIKPGEVADFLLSRSRDAGEILTNLKLQKLLYYAQAWFLALNDRELFAEDFQALGAWSRSAIAISSIQELHMAASRG
jgi:hypothetical protein